MTPIENSYRADLIRAAMASKEPPWTNEILADKAGLSMGTISAIRNGSPSVQLGSLIAIATALGLTLQELFEPKAEAA